jgi:hypothetical protein
VALAALDNRHGVSVTRLRCRPLVQSLRPFQPALNGHDAATIARQTGHRSLDTVLGYIRIATRFDANVTKAIGL